MAVILFAGFFALGTWQVERRVWKLDLIERVDQRVRAPAVAAPGFAQWSQISRDAEYLHVRLTGQFLHDRETLVQASTRLGGGFWVMTPLRQTDGTLVLVNRGFVASGNRDGATDRIAGPSDVTLTGLLRMTEPGGGFLRENDAVGNRWYSRDVQAIAAARGILVIAPFFVDVDATATLQGEAPAEPVGGLTVISFHNNHLVYALTWYALALMIAAAAWHVARDRKRSQRRVDENDGFSDEGSRNAGPD